MNFFEIAKNDQSAKYLFNMFGSMSGIIPSDVTGVSITILGTMFKTFNTMVLIVGILIIVYTTIVGVMQTAHEGEFMGKKWNNIWIPIRSVLGIIALVPTASGFSAIQMLMMWVIVQGIGAADTLWGTTLSYLDKVGSIGSVTIPTGGANQAIQLLFQELVCEATAKESKPSPLTVDQGNYFCNKNPNNNWCKAGIININPQKDAVLLDKGQVAGHTLLIGPPTGSCGELQYCDENAACTGPLSSPIKCVTCRAQINKLKELIPIMYLVASAFQSADYSYRNFYYQSSEVLENPDWDWIYKYCATRVPPIPKEKCCIPSRAKLSLGIEQSCKAGEDVTTYLFPPDQGQNPANANTDAVTKLYLPYMQEKANLGKTNFINTFTNEYVAALAAGVNKYLMDVSDKSPLNEVFEMARQSGWMLAGSYYYSIANMAKNNLQDSMPYFSVTIKDPDKTLQGYRHNYAAAGALISEMNAGGSPIAKVPGGGLAIGGLSSAQDGVEVVVKNVITSKVDNALYPLWLAGTMLLQIAEMLFGLMLMVTLIVGLAGNISVWFLGTGFQNPIGAAATLLYFLIAPAIFGVLGIMVTLGGTLSVYIPLIPYVIFTMGAIGWLISIVETMVAGPLVALGIISPSGQHELMGKAEPAIMLLLNNFLRPSLMIFGMIAAMFLSAAAVNLVNMSFGRVFTTLYFGYALETAEKTYGTVKPVSIIGLIFWLCSYVTLITAVLNKSFQVIYLLPQQVMRWIGGRGEEYGEAEGVSAMKGGMDAAKGKAGGAVGGGMGQAEHGAGKGMERQKYKDKQKEKEQKLTGKK